MSKRKQDYYEELGVGTNASEDEIRRAWRKKASKAHPDRGGTPEEMARINVAYETLTDASRRARYDETGEEEAPVKSMKQRGRDVMIATFGSFMLDEVNPLERTRAALLGEAEQKRSSLNGARTVLKKLRKLEKRLERRGGGDENFLRIATRDKCSEVETDIASFEERLEVLAAAVSELLWYALGPDPDEPPASGKAWLRIGPSNADANAIARDFWKGR